ncbi:FEN1 [Enterospora canceri]|uniref:Flap endonuclease 1 n=1 Tax=Enterospora canceri TaxID=1081671 RepID=A0A1Y1S6X8_9MICR|nr:FEN1 [Enterospora canceri]
MGIKNLSKLIKKHAPNGIKTRDFKYYTGHRIAVDASMCIYQFLISVRSEGANLTWGDSTTSHLNGLFYRTIRWIESGITPVFVFDGEAPAAKIHELSKREKRREEASEKLKEALEEKDSEKILKYKKMNMKMDKTHIEDAQILLDLLKIPYITAPSEAEAFCAWMCKEGFVDGVATEDMDTLCFGAPCLLRNFNSSKSKKMQIDEFNLNAILKELDFKQEQFIDLCILLGCDYSSTLKGIGQKKAYDLIEKYKSIEGIFEANPELEKENEGFAYKMARSIFMELSSTKMNSEVMEDKENKKNVEKLNNIVFRADDINLDDAVTYLVDEKGFDKTRITNGVTKLKSGRSFMKQTKIDAFFKRVN